MAPLPCTISELPHGDMCRLAYIFYALGFRTVFSLIDLFDLSNIRVDRAQSPPLMLVPPQTTASFFPEECLAFVLVLKQKKSEYGMRTMPFTVEGEGGRSDATSYGPDRPMMILVIMLRSSKIMLHSSKIALR